MRASYQILAVLMITALLGPLARAEAPTKEMLDLYQAITIAEGALAENGVSRQEVELVGVRWHVLPDNELVPRNPTLAYDKKVAGLLKGRTYWYVTFSTPGAEMGGQYAVFVDAKTREIIHFYIGR